MNQKKFQLIQHLTINYSTYCQSEGFFETHG